MHSQRTPVPRVMKFKILEHPSLVTIPVCLLYPFYAWDKRRRFEKQIMHFHYIHIRTRPYTTAPAPGLMKFTIS